MKKQGNSSRWANLILTATVILALGAFVVPVANAQGPRVVPRDSSPGQRIITPDSIAFGRTYGEWSAAWEQWADSVPVANHPLFDNGDCTQGQSGPVWFLGGKFCANNDPNCGYTNVVRTCNLPSGKALYIAVFNSEDSVLEDPGNRQIAGLRSFVSSAMDGAADLLFEIDGDAVPNLKQKYRVQSPAFGFTLPEDNLFKAIYPPGYADFAPGTYFPAVDDGVYVMVAPLPPGQHIVHFHGSVPTWNFTLDVTYFLNVATP